MLRDITDHFLTLVKQPFALNKRTPVFLFSHMRANTSLIGHILGSHPEIDGYYEMHIGYYSWKSLIRQKLIFAKDHKFKKGSKFIFDKVLHNGHYASPELLNENESINLFCLRSPIQTIPSIIKLFHDQNPAHELCQLEKAAEYYIERLEELVQLASKLDHYYYYDAETLKVNPTELLEDMTTWLRLSEPLQPKYKKQKLTGIGNAGDNSGNLEASTIKQQTTDYSDFEFPAKLKAKLLDVYEETRATLQRGCLQNFEDSTEDKR